MSPDLLEPLVWMDYRLAVLLTVTLPLVLLIWAFVSKAEAMQRLLVIYWRVASLLAISVYLGIAALPIFFVSGWIARILIPISLWFWVDLNEEIDDRPPSPLKWTLTSWRWATSVYCILGVLAQIPTLSCAGLRSQALLETASCRIWLDPPWGFKEIFHAGSGTQFLGFLGILGLTIYVLYLSYFVLIRLGKQGRSAMHH